MLHSTDTHRWSLTELSTVDLYVALRYGVGVAKEELTGIDIDESTLQENKEPSTALVKFRRAAAMPEQRLVLAEAYSFSYDALTNWVIRADLLRVEGIDADAAEVLAFAGIIGVHDLAHWDEWNWYNSTTGEIERRVHAIQTQFQKRVEELSDPEQVSRLRACMSVLDLEALVATAHLLAKEEAPQIVTVTDTLVVVKGAGLQAPEETVDSFLRGFWPAVKAIERHATITHRYDVFPPDYPASSPERQQHRPVTEIRAGERRIWVREAHWEHVLRPPAALKALFLEWEMAAYTFGSHLWEFVRYQRSRLRPDEQRRTWPRRVLRAHDFWEYYLAFVLAYLSLFLFLGWVFWDNGQIAVPLLRGFTSNALEVTLVAILVALLAAVPSAYHSLKAVRKKPLSRLPVMPKLLLLLMLVGFLGNPIRYLVGLVLLFLLQVALLIARDVAWPFRENPNSDTNLAEYTVETGEDGEPRVVRRYKRKAKFFLSPILYRYIVVLGLPIMLILFTLARLLKWSLVFRGVGNTLEKALHNSLSGVLGDVVAYAMDPAQAHRVRGVIERSISFFHHRPDVDHIHIFAHSLGTPITFETLFHYLPDLYRRKIKTYVTIGSVLSYYHQANPILDPLLIQRFPVRPYPRFAEGFRWYNFWNAFDPITEFSALDEYELYEIRRRTKDKHEAPAGEVDAQGTIHGNNDLELVPSQANPINIKTRGSWLPWAGHTEYWSNLAEVQIPFAYHILGDSERKEWKPVAVHKVPGNLSYFQYLTLLSLFFSGLLMSLALQTQRLSGMLWEQVQEPELVSRLQRLVTSPDFPVDVPINIEGLLSLQVIADSLWLLLLALLLVVVSWSRPILTRLAQRMADSFMKREEVPSPSYAPRLQE